MPTDLSGTEAMARVQRHINTQLHGFALPPEPHLDAFRFKAYADFLAMVQILDTQGLLRYDRDVLIAHGLLPDARHLAYFTQEYEPYRYLVLSFCAQLSELGLIERAIGRDIALSILNAPGLVPFMPVLGDLLPMLVDSSLGHFGLAREGIETPDILHAFTRSDIALELLTVNDSAYYYLTHAVLFHSRFGSAITAALTQDRVIDGLTLVGNMAFLLAHTDVLAEVVTCLRILDGQRAIPARWLEMIIANVSAYGFCPDLRYGVMLPVPLSDPDLFRRSYHCSLTTLTALSLYLRVPVTLCPGTTADDQLVVHIEMPQSHYRQLLSYLAEPQGDAAKARLGPLLSVFETCGVDAERLLARNIGRSAAVQLRRMRAVLH